MTTTTRRVAAPPPMRARDCSGSAVRLVKLVAPQRRTAVAVTVLGVAGPAIGVVVPRILGHATGLLFNGVIGRRTTGRWHGPECAGPQHRWRYRRHSARSPR